MKDKLKVHPSKYNEFGDTIENDGMDLRDYFANSVLQSYIKEHLELLRENKFGYSVDSIVDSCYVIADAMLKQREL